MIQFSIISFNLDCPLTVPSGEYGNLLLILIGAVLSTIFLNEDLLFDLALKKIQEFFSLVSMVYIFYLFVIDLAMEKKDNIGDSILYLTIPAVILLIIFGYLLYEKKQLEAPEIRYLAFNFNELNE